MKKSVFIFVSLFVLALAGLLVVFLTPPTYEVEYNMEYVDGMEILLTYEVVDQWGVPLTSYETVHEKEMHLIGVRTDLHEFVHVHPEMVWSGEWSADIDFPTEGPYEFYADFTPKDGEPQVLRFTVSVGEFVREKLGSYPQETDGYQFTYHFPETVTAGEVAYSITLGKDGEPVTVFEDYLGAKGHSVVIQEDTLNYEHAHAEGEEATQFCSPLPPRRPLRHFHSDPSGRRSAHLAVPTLCRGGGRDKSLKNPVRKPAKRTYMDIKQSSDEKPIQKTAHQ